MKQHNGRVWVENEPGHGSIFYFLLPVGYNRLKSARAFHAIIQSS